MQVVWGTNGTASLLYTVLLDIYQPNVHKDGGGTNPHIGLEVKPKPGNESALRGNSSDHVQMDVKWDDRWARAHHRRPVSRLSLLGPLFAMTTLQYRAGLVYERVYRQRARVYEKEE